MKTVASLVLFVLLNTSGFCQDLTYSYAGTNTPKTNYSKDSSRTKPVLRFDVHGAYERPVSMTHLKTVTKVDDISNEYPSKWVSDYESVKIITTSNGKSKVAVSNNNILTAEQKLNLSTAKVGSEINIQVRYKTLNSANDQKEIRNAYFSATVVPDEEAIFPGNQQKLNTYIKENVVNKISEMAANEMSESSFGFLVNENGEASDVKIIKSTGDMNTDILIIEAISKMPKWKPAEDSKGGKLKQEFKFNLFNANKSGC